MTSINGSGAVTISQTESVRENENSKKREDKKMGRKQTGSCREKLEYRRSLN